MEEIWGDIYFRGMFSGKRVSNLGRVKSAETGEILKSSDNGNGYSTYFVMSWKDYGVWRSKREYIHRLVATAFIPNPCNLKQVNHKDCNKTNNMVDNLEWVSGNDNISHAHSRGRMKNRVEYGQIVHLTPSEVDSCYRRVKSGETINEVSRSMGKSRTTVSSIINKRSRSSITDLIDEELLAALCSTACLNNVQDSAH